MANTTEQSNGTQSGDLGPPSLRADVSVRSCDRTFSQDWEAQQLPAQGVDGYAVDGLGMEASTNGAASRSNGLSESSTPRAQEMDGLSPEQLATILHGVIAPMSEASKHRETQETERLRLSLQHSGSQRWERVWIVVGLFAFAAGALAYGQVALATACITFVLYYLNDLRTGHKARQPG